MKVQGIDASSPAPQLTKGAKAAEEFEAYLIGFLCKQMREAVPEGPLNTGATGMFADLLDQEIGKRAAHGQGIGLRHQLELALARHAPAQEQEQEHEHEHEPVMARIEPVRRAAHGITSGFGLRADPFNGRQRMHDGVDIKLPMGSPVRAERGGRISFAGDRGGYGNLVIVEHGGGLETRYAHCAALNVEEGDYVEEGAVIGSVGSTGRSTGPHLHLEVRQDGEPTDPQGFFRNNY